MRMRSVTKKERERYYLNLFRSLFPPFPEGSIEDGESPDFVIHASTRRIGIELTRVYKRASTNRPPLQVQESERQALVAEACQIYQTMKLDPVQVSFFFATETSFTKKNRKNYAHALANLVANNLPAPDSWIDLVNEYDAPESFPFEVHSLSTLRFSSLTRNAWSTPDGGLVQEDCRIDFQRTISEKEALIQSYRDCSEYWLLVVADWLGPSSFFEPSQETVTHTYRATFDRVFFLNPSTRGLVQLALERGAG
jgi:hypothetical protein